MLHIFQMKKKEQKSLTARCCFWSATKCERNSDKCMLCDESTITRYIKENPNKRICTHTHTHKCETLDTADGAHTRAAMIWNAFNPTHFVCYHFSSVLIYTFSFRCEPRLQLMLNCCLSSIALVLILFALLQRKCLHFRSSDGIIS